jgi:hypothetical protein
VAGAFDCSPAAPCESIGTPRGTLAAAITLLNREVNAALAERLRA